jgi:hypothetical protein
MNRRNFITTAALAIPTLTMGISLKPNIPEVINADYIWDVLISKLPKPEYFHLGIHQRTGIYYDSDFNQKYGNHTDRIPIYDKKTLIRIETNPDFLYWRGIIWGISTDNNNTIYIMHFKKEYRDEYIKRISLNPYNYASTLRRVHTLLEDWV